MFYRILLSSLFLNKTQLYRIRIIEREFLMFRFSNYSYIKTERARQKSHWMLANF